jgi:hypothetical protein
VTGIIVKNIVEKEGFRTMVQRGEDVVRSREFRVQSSEPL